MAAKKKQEEPKLQAPVPTFHNVRIAILDKDSLKALASIQVKDAIYLTGLRVVEGKNGLFVAMPNRKTAGGEYQDVYFRDELQRVVLEAYHQENEAAAA